MGNITLEQIIAALAIIWALYESITKAQAIHLKPSQDVLVHHEEDMKEIRKEISALKISKADIKDMGRLEQYINLNLKIEMALLEHAITGNHTIELEKLKQEVQEFLIVN
ncbi:MAG: hypothetical protein KBT03_03270 [Bacteroidales bacterium]|nr:hypothetical protein [Candidatus Scybalousia scybalohippi]